MVGLGAVVAALEAAAEAPLETTALGDGLPPPVQQALKSTSTDAPRASMRSCRIGSPPVPAAQAQEQAATTPAEYRSRLSGGQERDRLMPPGGPPFRTGSAGGSARQTRGNEPSLKEQKRPERGEGQHRHQHHAAEQLAVVPIGIAQDDETAQAPKPKSGSERGRGYYLNGRQTQTRGQDRQGHGDLHAEQDLTLLHAHCPGRLGELAGPPILVNAY